MVDLLGPIASDDLTDPIELGSVDQEAWVDRCRVGDNPQAKTGRAAAIGHRLADVDYLNSADRPVARDMITRPAGLTATQLP